MKGYKSAQLIDLKVAEAEYLLRLIREPQNRAGFVEINAIVNAFVSTTRNVTFTMQYVLKNVDGFETWYTAKQNEIKKDVICSFFHNYRTATIHHGQSFITAGTFKNGGSEWHFVMNNNSCPGDVYNPCRIYFIKVLEIVFGCYTQFKYTMSERWYYSKENFQRLGKTITDADTEIIGIPGWTSITGSQTEEPERWRLLQQKMIGCQIQPLFKEYLAKEFKEPS